MGRYNTNLQDHEYFYRHFNQDTEAVEVSGTICLAVNKFTGHGTAAAAIVHENDQFSKKIGRNIARGRANQAIADPSVRKSPLIHEFQNVGESPVDKLFELNLENSDDYTGIFVT